MNKFQKFQEWILLKEEDSEKYNEPHPPEVLRSNLQSSIEGIKNLLANLHFDPSKLGDLSFYLYKNRGNQPAEHIIKNMIDLGQQLNQEIKKKKHGKHARTKR